MNEPDKTQQPFGKDNLGEEISSQVYEDIEDADEIGAQEDDIAHQTVREFEDKARFEGEDEDTRPDSGKDHH